MEPGASNEPFWAGFFFNLERNSQDDPLQSGPISSVFTPLTWGYNSPVTHLVSAICRGLYSSIYNDRLGAHLVGIVPLKRSVGMLNRFSQLQNSTVTNVPKVFFCEGCFEVYKKRADCFWPLNPWDFRSMEI